MNQELISVVVAVGAPVLIAAGLIVSHLNLRK